jgi:2-dehydro-3-deoxygluconokinase
MSVDEPTIAAPVSTSGVITFGETMGLLTAVDIGPLELARQFRYGIGGAESNVAIGIARLGQTATWFGRVGLDATGDMIERRLRAEQVTTLAIRDRHPTGLMIKHSRFAQAQHLDYHRHHSAASALTPADIPHDALRAARILHLTGITPALSSSAAETVFAAVEAAKGFGILISVDVNYRRKLWAPEDAAPVLRRLVEQADIVFAGPEEAQLVLDDNTLTSDADLAKALNDLGSRETIIKAGSRGCSAIIDGQPYRRAALDVRAVDTVGAGDAFVAGYLTERLHDASPETRIETAIHVGALAVTVPGDCEGLPTLADLQIPLDIEDVHR